MKPVGLDAIPYLDRSNLRGRKIVILPYWDGEGWHIWHPHPEGFLALRPIDAAHADYVAREAARPEDLFIPFVDLMWQRFSWSEIDPRTSAVREDFHNLFASVSKLRHFHASRNAIETTALSTFVVTELEYILTVSRSVFDLVQETISILWKRYVLLHDPIAEARRKARELPHSFTTFCFERASSGANETPRTAAQIVERFGIPSSLAEAYERQQPFFGSLRSMRDRIVHGLGRSPIIYCTEKGFAVHPDAPPFAELVSWKPEHRYNSGIVTLLPWLANVVLGVVDACSDLMAAFGREITLPPEMAPGYRVFMRSPCSEVVGDLLRIRKGKQLWWNDAKVE